MNTVQASTPSLKDRLLSRLGKESPLVVNPAPGKPGTMKAHTPKKSLTAPAPATLCLSNTCDFVGGLTFPESPAGSNFYQAVSGGNGYYIYYNSTVNPLFPATYGAGWYVIKLVPPSTVTNLFYNSAPNTVVPLIGWEQKNSECSSFTINSGVCPVACTTPTIFVSASPSLTITSGGSVTLTATGATSYTWSNGVQSSSVVLTNVTSATTLSVTGTTGTCSATASAAVSVTQASSTCDASTWTAHLASEANSWNSVTFGTVAGNGLFVAVSGDGTNRVMTSPDGITWTARTAAEANSWNSVTYGNGLFVAVSGDGTNRVTTSPDGITWTARTAAAANFWTSVTYGNGLFVAVASTGTGANRIMTSPDGITWTIRTAAQGNPWTWVTFGTVAGNGLFVAVSTSGANRVMTSPDGITWTARTAAAANFWTSVTYGNGLFVAVAVNGTNQVMTSPDGVTWTPQTAVAANSWFSVTFGNGRFVAISYDGTNQVITSPEGITWTARTAAEANSWSSVTFGNGIFVSVANTGANQVMTACDSPVCSLSVAVTPSSQTVMSGGSVTLTATGATSYTWSNGVQSSSVVLTNVTSATTLSVTGTTGACSATASAEVSVTTAPVAASACVAGGCSEVNGTYVDSEIPSWQYGGFTTMRALKNTSQNTYMLFVTFSNPPESISQWVIVYYNTETESSSSRYTAAGSVETVPTSGWEIATENSACTNITVTLGACAACTFTVGITPASQTIGTGTGTVLTASTDSGQPADSYIWNVGSNQPQSGSAVTVTGITSATVFSVTAISGACSATASTTISVGSAMTLCVSSSEGRCAPYTGTFVEIPSPIQFVARSFVNPEKNAFLGLVSPDIEQGFLAPGWYLIVGESIYFTNSSSSSEIPLSGWQPSPDLELPEIIVTQGACPVTAPVEVMITGSPSSTMGIGSPGMPDRVTLTASGADSFTWSTGETSPSISVTTGGNYSVTGLKDGCSAMATVQVSVTAIPDPCSSLSIPATITLSGSDFDPFNGVYTRDEDQNGAPSWRLNTDGVGTLSISWAGGQWEFHTTNNTDVLFYASGSPLALPCVWTAYSSESLPPTVTEGCGSFYISHPLAVSITPSSQTVTAGGSVTLTASGADSYTWSNGVSGSAITVTNVTSATILSVTGTTGECSGTASAAVNVTAPSGSVITIGPLTGTATACVGTVSSAMAFTVAGTNLSTEPGNALNVIAPPGFEVLGLDGYTDQFGIAIPADGIVPPTTISVRTTSVAPAGSLSGTITLAASGATPQTLAVAATVISVTATIVPSSVTICPGISVTLTASGAGNGGSYRWSTSETTASISVMPMSTQTYALTATSSLGCSATTTATVSVTSPIALTTPTLPSSGSVVCEGGNTVVVASTEGPLTGYQWYKDGQTVTGQTSATLTLTGLQPAESGGYTLMVQGTCGSATSSAFSLTVNPLPTVVLYFSGSTQSITGGNLPVITLNGPLDPANLPVFQVLGGVQYTRLQTVDRIQGYEIQKSQISTTGVFPIDQLGAYRITVTGANGCQRTVQGIIQIGTR